MKKFIYILLLAVPLSCKQLAQNNNIDVLKAQAAMQNTKAIIVDTVPAGPATTVAAVTGTDYQNNTTTANNDNALSNGNISTGNTSPAQLMQFAETQIGVPYVYGSCNPKVGFDCSGFITFVFNHFNIRVPRSSYEFTHMGKTVPLYAAKRGDIILFTGTDSLATDVGHIGLITANNNGAITFIHSTSGRQMAVTVTTLDNYYKGRFVRISRVFTQNG